MIQLNNVCWGFIGCGEVTEKKSGPAFNMIDGSKVVAVMSRDEEKVKSYARRHNIPRWYTDAQELIGDEDVNAIYIATPPSSHATFAIMAMKAGKPVYIEKPMAASYEDCARINRISQETGVPCFVAYYRRYLPYFQKVRQLVEEGEIGNVINVQIRFAQPPRALDYNSTNLPWRVQPDIAGGGYFYDLAPHQLDFLQEMFGCILEAEGYTSNRGGLYQAEDTISACFKFASGFRFMVLRCSRIGKRRPYRNYR
jgi:1,5-anhydro-D-fructose reductase (1,5-anhydro-D-mannitol-forming)